MFQNTRISAYYSWKPDPAFICFKFWYIYCIACFTAILPDFCGHIHGNQTESMGQGQMWLA